MVESNNTSANKRIARNSIFMSIRMVIVLCITLYTTRVLLNALGVEDYGVYNVVCGFVSMFAFLNTSMSNGIQRFFNFELGKNGVEGAKKVYNTSLLIQFLLTIIIVILTESFGLWYMHYKMVIPPERFVAAQWIFQFSIISLVFVIMQAPYAAAIMAHERMDFYAIVSVLDAFLKLAIVLVLPFISADLLIIYGLLVMLISIVNFLLYYGYSKRKFEEIQFDKTFHRDLFKSMIRFSGWNIFGSLSGVMKEQGINLVLNAFFGPVVNAARGVAAQVNSGILGFVSNITIPVRPQVVQSYSKGDTKRVMNLTYSISKLSCFFLYLLALPICYEIDYVLHLWLGNNVPEHASVFVVIILMTSMMNNLNGAISAVVHATGIMRKYQLISSVTVLSSIPLAYFGLQLGLCPEFALWMVFLSMTLAQIAALVILKGLIEYSIKDYITKVLCPITFVIISTIWIPYIIKSNIELGFMRFFIEGVTSVLVVCISVYFLGLNNTEKNLIKSMVTSARHK